MQAPGIMLLREITRRALFDGQFTRSLPRDARNGAASLSLLVSLVSPRRGTLGVP